MRLFCFSLCLLAAGAVSWADPVPLRIVAANLTSGNQQTYSPDNGNHSNPEGAGARILKGLKPDVVLMQEFNTAMPARQWVNATFGEAFSFFVEAEKQPGGIPNGIVSRFPIVESGEWEDATQTNRDFAWAKIALPNGKFLWAVSVHLYSKKPDIRVKEAKALIASIRAQIPDADLLVLGGDFNTKGKDEACVKEFVAVFDRGGAPVDAAGDADTNAPRNKPYDWVVADKELAACAVPVKIGLAEFKDGLVFDSRVFAPLEDVVPVQKTDSAAPNMQHMAVVRDFLVP
jgi:endonuclease/exonuclease/phosphatase family metal-dependent hydrolase